MADEFLTVSPLDHEIPYRQTSIPNYRKATYVADDTDNHKLMCDGRGKGRSTVVVENPSDQNVVMTLYGCHTEDDDIGDAGVMEIADFTANAGDSNYQPCNDPFPYYIISCASAIAPDGSTVSIWVNFHAF